jgi:hypothetical protein
VKKLNEVFKPKRLTEDDKNQQKQMNPQDMGFASKFKPIVGKVTDLIKQINALYDKEMYRSNIDDEVRGMIDEFDKDLHDFWFGMKKTSFGNLFTGNDADWSVKRPVVNVVQPQPTDVSSEEESEEKEEKE